MFHKNEFSFNDLFGDIGMRDIPERYMFIYA